MTSISFNGNRLVVVFSERLEPYEKKEIERTVKSALKEYFYTDWG